MPFIVINPNYTISKDLVKIGIKVFDI